MPYILESLEILLWQIAINAAFFKEYVIKCVYSALNSPIIIKCITQNSVQCTL